METIFDSIYPLTIVMDRYNGAYSKGKFTAWNLDPDEIPTEPWSNDVECMCFWYGDRNGLAIGIGNTVEEAVGNLYIELKQRGEIDE